MRWLFLEFTSFTEDATLKSFPLLLKRVSEASSASCAELLTNSGLYKTKNVGKVVLDVNEGKRKCNDLRITAKRINMQGVLPVMNVQAHFIPNSHAFCWDHALPEDLTTTMEPLNKKSFDATVYALGVQKLDAREPSMVAIVAELDSEGTQEACQRSVQELVSWIGGQNSILVPDDLKLYGRQGQDVYAGGGFDIAIRTRMLNNDYDLWRNRFLQRSEWIGARNETIRELSSHCSPPPIILPTAISTASGESIALMRLDPIFEITEESAAARFFVTL